jgi:hypothetical protein
MPVHFVESPSFSWPPSPAVRAPAPPVKPKPKPKPKKKRKGRAVIPIQCRTVLIDRLEAAVEGGAIDLHDDYEHCDQLAITGGEYALLLRLLFPEDYAGPRKRPAKATLTPPASAERIAEYARRVSDGRPVTSRGDAGAVHPSGKQIVLAERRNGTGLRVVGWGEPEG